MSYLLIGFLISALGSIPVGMITLNIMKRAIDYGRKAAWIMSLGATVPEFGYTYIALYGFDFLNGNQMIEANIQLAATVFFFVLAIYYLYKSLQPQPMEAKTREGSTHFLSGLLIATMNVLIVPFWIFVAAWLETYDYHFDSQWILLIFSLGAALGALAIFIAYAELGTFLLHRVKVVAQYSNRVVGVIFLGLGLYQLFQLL